MNLKHERVSMHNNPSFLKKLKFFILAICRKILIGNKSYILLTPFEKYFWWLILLLDSSTFWVSLNYNMVHNVLLWQLYSVISKKARYFREKAEIIVDTNQYI